MAKYKPKIRLYINQDILSTLRIELDVSQNHYIQNVMRLETGDVIRVFDGISGEYDATINIFGKKKCIIEIQN